MVDGGNRTMEERHYTLCGDCLDMAKKKFDVRLYYWQLGRKEKCQKCKQEKFVADYTLVYKEV